MTSQEIQTEALDRAQSNSSTRNYYAIIQGFSDKGIDPKDVSPRENVFTFHAWKALGRCVCKGEHGIKITTFIPCKSKKVDEDGNKKTYTRPKNATVFHISQTKKTN